MQRLKKVGLKDEEKKKKVGENRPEGDTAIANFVQFSRQA